jgi:hypothetical protein
MRAAPGTTWVAPVACRHQTVERAQLADDIAAHLLSEELRELAAGDRLKIPNRGEHEILGARQRLEARSPHRQVDRIGELLAGAQMPGAGHGNEIVGSTTQLGADVLDDQVEIAICADDAGEDLARDRCKASLPRRSPLVQDAAYGTLLRETRRTVHFRIGCRAASVVK